MKFSLRVLSFAILLFIGIVAHAQQHELAITVGGQFPYNNQFDSGASLSLSPGVMNKDE